jgi:hypothetical protein
MKFFGPKIKQVKANILFRYHGWHHIFIIWLSGLTFFARQNDSLKAYRGLDLVQK